MIIYENSQITMSFFVEYLNVRNFRDADTSYLYDFHHTHSQLHSSLYAHKRHTQNSKSDVPNILAPPQLPEVHTTDLS